MAIVGEFPFEGQVIYVHDDASYTWSEMSGDWTSTSFEIHPTYVKLIHHNKGMNDYEVFIGGHSSLIEKDFSSKLRKTWTAYEHILIEQILLQKD